MHLKSYFIAKHRFFLCGLERVNWKEFNLFTSEDKFWGSDTCTYMHSKSKGPRIVIENSRHQNNLLYWCGTDDGKLRTDFSHILNSIRSLIGSPLRFKLSSSDGSIVSMNGNWRKDWIGVCIWMWNWVWMSTLNWKLVHFLFPYNVFL